MALPSTIVCVAEATNLDKLTVTPTAASDYDSSNDEYIIEAAAPVPILRPVSSVINEVYYSQQSAAMIPLTSWSSVGLVNTAFAQLAQAADEYTFPAAADALVLFDNIHPMS